VKTVDLVLYAVLGDSIELAVKNHTLAKLSAEATRSLLVHRQY